MDDPARRRRGDPRRHGRAGAGPLPAAARLRGVQRRARPGARGLDARPARRWWASCGSPRRPSVAVSRCRCRRRRSTSQDDRWRLEYREMLPVESWNAQISLLTGFAAASIMIRRARSASCARCRRPRTTRSPSCGVRPGRWGSTGPAGQGHPDFIRSLDPSHPRAGRHGRGLHLAAPRRRVRRLRRPGPRADRARGTRLDVRPCHGAAPPSRRPLRTGDLHRAVRRANRCRRGSSTGSTTCRTIMRDSGRRSHAYENAVLNLVEAVTLQTRVGETVRGRRHRARPRRRAQGHGDGP